MASGSARLSELVGRGGKEFEFQVERKALKEEEAEREEISPPGERAVRILA